MTIHTAKLILRGLYFFFSTCCLVTVQGSVVLCSEGEFIEKEKKNNYQGEIIFTSSYCHSFNSWTDAPCFTSSTYYPKYIYAHKNTVKFSEDKLFHSASARLWDRHYWIASNKVADLLLFSTGTFGVTVRTNIQSEPKPSLVTTNQVRVE